MSRSGDRFHAAARDGYLDLLREATKRDANRPDEDGLTPTLWASFHGNLAALRMLIGRGGDPDRCDHLGNTCLHLAAAGGRLHCVTFLVAFGANLWALDNDFHTALDLAALNSHQETLRYLDDVVANQSARNKKVVRKLKERAALDAGKRVKKFEKMKKKLARKQEKLDLQRSQDELRPLTLIRGQDKYASVRSDTAAIKYAKYSTSSRHSARSEPRSYSQHTIGPCSGRGGKLSSVVSKIQRRRRAGSLSRDQVKVALDGRGTVRSVTGLRGPSNVLLLGSTDDVISRAASEPDMTQHSGDSGYEDSESPGGTLFERPGFGSVSFIRGVEAGTLLSLPDEPIRREGSIDSIGTAGSLAARMSDLPWGDDVIADDDVTVDELALFLRQCGLEDVGATLHREQVDLASLMLLTEQDFREMDLPIGPRRKLMEAVSRRKTLLKKPRVEEKTHL